MKTKILFALMFAIFWSSCSSLDPRNPIVDLPEGLPTIQTTAFTNALSGLGRMSVVYGSKNLTAMFNTLQDVTGTNQSSGGEIPIDITEMATSALNSIGGNVRFMPFNPNLIQEYSKAYGKKFNIAAKPDIFITGGITQFDRGLETSKKGVNVSANGTFNKKDIGLDADFTEQASTASITVDFNAIDFDTQVGIPGIQAVNQIKVYKAVKDNELGFTVMGPSVGLSGSMKKIQGRHAAVRLLVQLSMLQMVGRYLKLPYWNLLPGIQPDEVVLDAIRKDFYNMDRQAQAKSIQRFASATGNPSAAQDISAENYVKLYCSLPVSGSTSFAFPSTKAFAPSRPPASIPPAMVSADTPPQPPKLVKPPALKVGSPEVPSEDVIKIQTKVELNRSEIVFDATFKPEQNVTLNRTFQSDDKIKIYFAATKDAYFYWFMKGASGAHYMLYPNQKTGSNNFVRKNSEVSVPSSGNFRFDNQPGIEEINVVFSDERIPELDQAAQEALSNDGMVKNSWMSVYEAMNNYQKITLRMKHN